MRQTKHKQVWGLFFLLVLLPLVPGFICNEQAGFQRISPEQGFGDSKNKYSWSMGELDGKVYVGTLNMTFLPLQLEDLPPFNQDPIELWEDVEGLIKSDGGEIWRYDPADGSWLRVFDMKEIAPGNIGFRVMLNFKGALYAGTLNIEGPAEIWTSPDGENWSLSLQLGGRNKAVRALAVVGDYLYAGTDNRDRNAELWRFDGASWELAHALNDVLMIGVLTEIDGLLYIATWDQAPGFELYSYDGANVERLIKTSDHPKNDQGIMAMHPFRGKLYLGTVNFIRGAALYCYDPATGELDEAAPRGFGQPANVYLWRMEAHRGKLYVGTFNSSTMSPLNPLKHGLQLWSSADGDWWEIEEPNGFGDRQNYGVRALFSTGDCLYVGTANNMFIGAGTEVWMRDDTP